MKKIIGILLCIIVLIILSIMPVYGIENTQYKAPYMWQIDENTVNLNLVSNCSLSIHDCKNYGASISLFTKNHQGGVEFEACTYFFKSNSNIIHEMWKYDYNFLDFAMSDICIKDTPFWTQTHHGSSKCYSTSEVINNLYTYRGAELTVQIEECVIDPYSSNRKWESVNVGTTSYDAKRFVFNQSDEYYSLSIIKPTTLYDVNGDNVIDLRDLVRLKRKLAQQCVDIDAWASDIDKNCEINAIDLIKLKKYFANGVVEV